MNVTQLLGYINVKYIAIYLFFIFYFIVSFGAGTSAHYRYAPYLLLSSVLCIFVYRNSRNDIVKNKLLSSLLGFAILVILFSINYMGYTNPLCPYIQYLSYSLLPFVTCFAIYRFVSNGKKEFDLILLIFIVFFITGIIRFFHEASVMRFFGSDFKSNNTFYQVLMPLPILFLGHKKILRFVFLIVAIYICVLSMKRSALISVSIIMVIYLYREVLVDKKSRLYTIIILLFSLFVFSRYIDLSAIYDSINVTMERMDQISEDGGSGRLDMISKFIETDFYDVCFVFGKGFMGYHDKYPGVLASHNDLVEIYYSYGTLGLVLFFTFFWRLLKNTFKEIKSNTTNVLSYISALVLFILYTFAGGCFTFVNLSLSFFSFIALSQAQFLIKNDD